MYLESLLTGFVSLKVLSYQLYSKKLPIMDVSSPTDSIKYRANERNLFQISENHQNYKINYARSVLVFFGNFTSMLNR